MKLTLSLRSLMTISLCLLTGSAFAQTTADSVAPSEPISASRATTQSTREQAYLRFLEARRLRSDAQRQQNQKLFDQAIAAYRDTIWLDPKSAEPRVDLGELYFFFRNDVASAEREALEALRLDPQCVGAHRLLARLSMALMKFSGTNKEEKEAAAQFNRALTAYEAVTRLDAGDAEAWALLSDLYQAKNDTPRYTHALERWASLPIPIDQAFYGWFTNQELTPDRAFAQLSQVYLAQGKKREAFDAARRAYEFNPENTQYAGNLIGILSEAQTVEQALKTYAQLSKSAPSAALEIGYGATLTRAARYAEAIERLRPLANSDPINPNVVSLLTTAQRRANQRAAAAETLKQALPKVEAAQRAGLVFEYAETLEELGRNEEALTQYEQLYDSLAQSGRVNERQLSLFGRVVSELARLHRRLGNNAKLQSLFTRTRKVTDEQTYFVERAQLEGLREEGKRREALDLVRATMRRAPQDKNLKLTEITLLAEEKRFRECEDLLLAMLESTPERASEDAIVQMVLSSVQLQAGNLNEAEKAARQALALDATNPSSTLQLASVLDRNRKNDEAEKLLRDLMQRAPDNATVLNNLGYALAERGEKLPEALALIERALTIEPLNGNFLDSLGWAQYKAGQFEQARTTLEKALVHARRNATIHEHLGDVFAQLGRPADARRAWEKALTLSLGENEIARLKGKLREPR
ncbi:MAG: tetratricopeptide repeat protein [Acidobacteria bacterium]|nr:tetratricopeptide repeat protein [Acidobacteriota bacterium]